MKLLFIHPNMPGQYKHLAAAFARDPENQVVFVTKRQKGGDVAGAHKIIYKPAQEPNAQTHRYLHNTERAMYQGQQVYRVCRQLKIKNGFVPDIICAHPGWGDALFIKDLYPGVPLLSYFEFYYRAQNADVGFDPADPLAEDDFARIRAKNIVNLLNLEAADHGISPTRWQHGLHPVEFQHKITILHDGVDTNLLTPETEAEVTLPDGTHLTAQDEVITYVARNLEPYRGFPSFMKAAEIILRERPHARIVAVGGDGVSYGKPAPKGTTWREIFSKQVRLNPARIHFTGLLPYDTYAQLLRVSAAHIYLTYPFVLSWSMLEAMSSGCLVVGSRTAPVEEVIKDGENGLLVDFFNPEDIAAKVIHALENRAAMQDIRRAARETVVQNYDLATLLPQHMNLVQRMAGG